MLRKCLAVLVLGVLPAGAAVTYQATSATDLANHVTGLQTLDLSTILGQSSTSFSFSGGDLAFSNPQSVGLTIVGNVSGWPNSNVLARSTTGGEIDVQLPANTVAFGAYFGMYQSGLCCSEIDITYSGGTIPLTGLSNNSPVYVGLIFDSPVSSFSVVEVGSFGRVGIDQFSWATGSGSGGSGGSGDEGGSETPEPPTLALMGVSLIALPVLARRRRRLSSRLPVAAL